ncbi:hypothetical protein R9C00_11055 [Flammeovirgaceae bacterium SG7u.111]|nr:hypothetical protein [Flammeovirgaceae bacterium SG7u.132]WPO37989.1 hypothetical protein R9C00_11055 [Flammeovirgaceae bacterium SG7u.111]
MYKLTVGDKTVVGCNEDAWRTTSKIWFENAQNPYEYGAGFTGSRQVSSNRFAPQSGMNEAGLVFSRLVAYYPQKSIAPQGKKITNEVSYLSEILHTCSTVEEVAEFINQYDHSIFIDDVFIYIDSSGKYLVVEPYELIVGNDANYVLSNFCPSITEQEQANKLIRYKNGKEFLKTHDADTSLAFCTSLADTMHVCRNRNGDGTLLTSIWDTKNRSVNLYFYHQYDSSVQFGLAEELAKGDHIINIPDLFPKNSEFERLATYKTPFNTPELRVSLVVLGGILTFSAFLLCVFFFINKSSAISFKTIALLSGMNVLLTSYLFVLATNSYIYYFDAPYTHYSSSLISASSYIPFLLLLTIAPVTSFTLKRFKSANTKRRTKALLISNNLIYLLLIVSFGYWGLYSVWN